MITLNDFHRQWEDTRVDVLEAVQTVGSSGWYILGAEVEAFEKALAGLWKLGHCVGVASGLDAIEISLKAVGCKPGERVLTTPLSAFATTVAIVKLGAIPVFPDCDDQGLIDLEQCREILRARPEIRFFVPVHLYGHSLDLNALRSIRDESGVSLIEDCAQSILATNGDIPTGSIGHMAATSFYPTKNLGALGDGGAILSSDADLAARARCLRDYGQSGKYQHAEIGYNSRLDELQAAILRRVQLPRLERWTSRRREVAARYSGGIKHNGIRLMGSPRGSHSCWHLFPVAVDAESKGDFLKWLKSRGVAGGEHYPTLIPDQPAMQATAHELIGDCSRARRIARGEVSLPVHPYMTDEEIDNVIGACNQWGA